MKIVSHPAVADKFESYPEGVKMKLEKLRNLILETAVRTESISEVEETLKWGEPSYLTKKGSTIRIDWKAAKPEQYAMYFQCTSKLVPSFREVFGEQFSFEGNRAIVFQMEEQIPEDELSACIASALRYHSIKHLPNLGLA
ncbi:MAG: DUF1801 domain-containing protein [Bacteroidota bacterium]